MPSIGFLPLDDRPCSVEFPQRIADIMGLRLQMPPRDALGTFLEAGRCRELESWLRQYAPRLDILIVSLDMLLYGGLAASRLPGVEIEQARVRMEVLREIKAAHPQLALYGWNVIMRTSITVGDELASQHWQDMNRFAVLWARAQTEELDAGETEEMKALADSIPEAVREQYFAARRRNHRINRQALDLAADGVFEVLLLTQDDAHPQGPNALERQTLAGLVPADESRERIFLHPGADEGGMVLLARALSDWHQISPGIACSFYPAGCADHTAVYEDVPLAENVESQVRAAGLMPAGEGRLWAAVCGPDEAAGRVDMPLGSASAGGTAAAYDRVWKDIRRAGLDGKMPLLCDVRHPNGGSEELFRRLRGQDLTLLGSYAGWNTAANTIGTAAAHAAVAAFAQSLGRCNEEAQRRFLIERVLDDYLFQTKVRPQMAGILEKHPSWGSPFQLTEEGWRQMDVRLQKALEQWLGPLEEDYGLKAAAVEAHLPWPRLFEASVSVTL